MSNSFQNNLYIKMGAVTNMFFLIISIVFGFITFIYIDSAIFVKHSLCNIYKLHTQRGTRGLRHFSDYNNIYNKDVQLNNKSQGLHILSNNTKKKNISAMKTSFDRIKTSTASSTIIVNNVSKTNMRLGPIEITNAKRCNAYPSKKFKVLASVHRIFNQHINTNNSKSIEGMIKQKFPSFVFEKGWLTLTNINIKNRNGRGHSNVYKKENRSNCQQGKNSYTWDSHAKECMYPVPQTNRMLALIELGHSTACKFNSNACKIFLKAIGDMFHRLEALEKQCVDIVKSGKISTHFPDHRSFNNLGTVENENEAPSRIIVSMTTIPSRFENADAITKAIKSVLFDQVMNADIVWISVPKISRRFGNAYPPVPPKLKKLERESNGRFSVLTCEDFGPATKLIPALQHARPNDIVITADDDSLYQPWVIGNLVRTSVEKAPNSIVSHIGYKLKGGKPRHPNFQYYSLQWHAKKLREVDFIAGLGAVLYKRRFFFNAELSKIFQTSEILIDNAEGEQRRKNLKFTSFLEAALETDQFIEGRYVDDDYISGIASVMGVSRIITPACDDCGYGVIWSQVTEANALSSGHNKDKNIDRQFHVISNFQKLNLLPTACKRGSKTKTRKTIHNRKKPKVKEKPLLITPLAINGTNNSTTNRNHTTLSLNADVIPSKEKGIYNSTTNRNRTSLSLNANVIPSKEKGIFDIKFLSLMREWYDNHDCIGYDDQCQNCFV